MKITEKKAEIKESQRQCRAENNGRKVGKKHKQDQTRRNKVIATTTMRPE